MSTSSKRSTLWRRTYPAARDASVPLDVGIAMRRYVVSEVGLHLLDGGWRIIAIRYLDEERFLWDRGAGSPLRDVRVDAGRVDRAIASFLAWAAVHGTDASGHDAAE